MTLLFFDRKQRGSKEPLDEVKEGVKKKKWLKPEHSKNENHGIWSHHFMANRCGNNETVTDFIFLGSIITMDGDMSLSKFREMVKDREAWHASKGRTQLSN